VFLNKPSVLVLDETLAALEPALQANIFNTILGKYRDETCIFVTDFMPLHRKADRIIVLDKGRIVEDGSYAQLSRQKGHYHHLYQLDSVPIAGGA
ncbi:MAG: hypothetical protein KTR14_09845, partial [Vampirovibrio sp.]|nr:hypothetical protein [Vampirovibrio sp.]